MRVIRPIKITPDMVLSSSLVETEATWSSATSYSKENKVVYSERLYESLQDSNSNHQPDTSPTWWLDIGPSNKSAWYDMQVSTQSAGTSPVTLSIKPGTSITSIAFINISATSISLELLDGESGPQVFQQTIDLDGTIITDWFDYFFEEPDLRDNAVILNIPPYQDCVINITLSSPTTVLIGAIIIGMVANIGQTQYGITLGIRDYSAKKTDDFGNTTFKERAFSKRMQPSVFISNNEMNKITKILTKLRATPTAWIGSTDERFQSTIIYGFIRDWNIEIPYPEESLLRLEIEGLV